MGEAYLVRRGGGAVKGGGLNFEVVGGTTQPSSPKENTIWINTDQEITGWTINGNDPTAMQTELYNSDIGLTTGYYLQSNGTQKSSSDWRYTNNIQLPENTKSLVVTMGTKSSTAPYHVFYNEAGEFVSSVQRQINTNTYDVPDGAVSIKLSILNGTDNPSLIAVHSIDADAGVVWIENGNKNAFVSFNALAENEILVNVAKLVHYQDGQWVIPDVKIYQAGDWRNVNKLVPWNGETLADWVEFGLEYNSEQGTFTINEEEKCLYLYVPKKSGSQNVVYITEPIDVTPYRTITCKTYIRGWYGGYFGLTSDPTALTYSSSTGSTNCGVGGLTAQCRPIQTSNTAYEGTDTLDISNVNGLQYFVFGTAATASSPAYDAEVKVYSIEFSV